MREELAKQTTYNFESDYDFRLGDYFIVLSNDARRTNCYSGYRGAIFGYQKTFAHKYTALYSPYRLEILSAPNFTQEADAILIPTIRPFFSMVLNNLYAYYTNWAENIGGGKRGGLLGVYTAERFFRSLGQVPQDGQYFEMTNDSGEREVCQLVEYRGDSDYPYSKDRKGFTRTEPAIEYIDGSKRYHKSPMIDIFKRDIICLGGTPTMFINPGECFCEVLRDDMGNIIETKGPCYMCIEWRKGSIGGQQQRYMDIAALVGYYGTHKIDKFSEDVFTEKKLVDGFKSGKYAKIRGAYNGYLDTKYLQTHFEEVFVAGSFSSLTLSKRYKT